MTDRNSATNETDSGPQGTTRDGQGEAAPQPVPIIEAVKPQSHDGPPDLVMQIGETTYRVWAHFSQTSKETLEDKIKRMLREDVRRMMKAQ